MPDRPTFDEAPMRAAEVPAGPAMWHMFVTLQFEDGERIQIEYVAKGDTILEGFEKAIADVARVHAGDGKWSVVELTGKQLPDVLA